MNESTRQARPASPLPSSRRLFLQRTALAAAIGGIGLATLQHSWLTKAWGQTMPADDGFAAFMQLSSYLTGKKTLDVELGHAIYAGLADGKAAFAEQVHALNALLASTPTPAAKLQQTLDQAKSPLAAAPKQIMAGWYLGVVGSGKTARAVAFEQALMYAPVADVIVLNTYARGVPGYWAQPPVLPA